MKSLLIPIVALFALAFNVAAQGFMEIPVRIYGKVIQVDANVPASDASLLHTGSIQITFVNVDDATDTSTHSAALGRLGPGGVYSYAIDVSQQYLPQQDDVLRVDSTTRTYRLDSISIDGSAALPLEPDQELINTRFDLRGLETRLDLKVNSPIIDSDRDGIPDWWEELHGLNPLFADDGSGDPDGDGIQNRDEFAGGSNPQVANTDPLLQTVAIRVYERGYTGLWLDAVDSDVANSANFIFTLRDITGGFKLSLDGGVMSNNDTFTLDDVQNGRLTLNHPDNIQFETITNGLLQVETDAGVHDIVLELYNPTATDGSGATVWLDGNRLLWFFFDGPNANGIGDYISTFADRSGNNNHARNDTLWLSPTIIPGGGVDFADNIGWPYPSSYPENERTHLLIPAAAVPAGPHTAVLAYKAPSQLAQQTVFASNSGRLDINPNDGPIAYPSAETYSAGLHRVVGADTASGDVDISITVADGPDSASSYNRHRNGYAESAAPSPEPLQFAIGGALDPNGFLSSPFAGTLNELIIFPRALSPQRRIQVNDYLQSKWLNAVVWDYADATHPITLSVADGDNILRGGWANDVLQGGPGADLLAGAWGNDTLTGGGGSDRFVYRPQDGGHDRILDFDKAADVIDLAALFPTVSTAIDEHIQFAIVGVSNDSTIRIDLNGDGGAPEIQITIPGMRLSNTDRDRWIGDGSLQTGGLRLPQTVSIAVAQSEAIEADGQVEFTIERSGPANYALEVPLGLSGDAVPNVDYALSGLAGSATRPVASFAVGESQTRIPVSLLANNATEGDRSIRIYLHPSRNYALGAASSSLLLGDGPQTVSIAATVDHCTEGEALPGEFRLLRQGPTDTALTVSVRVLGSSQNGLDFPFIPSVLTFPVGASNIVLSVEPYADNKVESAETVELVLLESQNYAISGLGRATVEIQDFTARVSITAIAGIALRDGNIPGYFLLTRSGNLDQDMIVNLTRSGTASNGVDHAHIHDFVRFAPGSASVLIPVAPIGGPTGTGNKTVVLTIVENAAYLRANPIAATVAIVDDADSASVVTIAASNTIASEDGPVSSSFTLTRSGPSTELLAVDLLITGSAESGIDYGVIPTSLAIGPGVSEIVIPVIPILDGAAEQLENVTITVQAGSNYLVGNSASADVFIEDDTLRVIIEAEQAAATLVGPVSGRFVLRRNKGIASPLSVTLDLSGTADAGDYAAFTNPVNFAADSAEATIEIAPIDTGETHDVTVTLSIAASNGFPATDPGTATVTIDRDAARAARSVAQRITVTPLRPTVGPGTGEAGFLLERSGELTQDLSVRLSASGILANGEDYSYISPIAIFPPGERSIKVLLEPISWKEGAVVISASPVTAARSAAPNSSQASVIITRDGLASINVVEGWNMLSLPLDGPEMRPAEIFGSSLRNIVEFTDGDYQPVTILEPTHGYWIYSDEKRRIELPGRYRISGTRNVGKGWQMVGPLADNPALRDVAAIWAWDPAEQRYVFTDRDDLRLNRGYMVYVPEEAELNLGL